MSDPTKVTDVIYEVAVIGLLGSSSIGPCLQCFRDRPGKNLLRGFPSTPRWAANIRNVFEHCAEQGAGDKAFLHRGERNPLTRDNMRPRGCRRIAQ